PEGVAPEAEQGTAEIPMETRGKEKRQAFHLVPVERTSEELYAAGLDQQEIDAFVQANLDEINADIEKHNKKKPKMGTNIAAYKEAKDKWQAVSDDLGARLDYYRKLQEHIKDITTSEMAKAVNAPVADVSDITTPEDFIAAQLGGIKITPESFRKETGLSATEQKALVGVIAGEDKGGVSVERAAEIITENYSEELAGLGFNGDMQDVRNAIIDILSGGNPKTYAKRAAEARQAKVVDERRVKMDYVAQQLGFDNVDELIAYEETILPRIIQQYAGFDEPTYYSILADENYNYHDTTRESETIGNSSEVLQGKESDSARGIESVGERNEGREVPSDVQGGTETAAAQGEEQVSEPVNEGVFDPRNMSDEERIKRGDMLRNATAVDVEEGVITSTKDLSARKAAEKWWDENVAEPAFYNTEVGEVEISRNSIESSLAHRYGQAKLDALTSLIEGFENAVYLGSMPDGTRHGGVMNHYFAYPINYKGERCYVFCRAMHDANKNRLYVHEVFIADKIKKGDTLQTAASQPHGGIALYKDILANVLDIEPTSTAESTTQSSNVQENFVKSGENAQNEGEKDVIEEMREQNRVAEERQQRAGVPPRMSDYSTAINAEDTEAQKAWEDRFNDYLDKLTADDLSTVDSTISSMQGNKEAIKAGNPAGYMENPNYKAFDNIEKMLKKRKRELEKSSTNVEKRQDVEEKSTTGGAQAEQTENANLQTEQQTEPTISQESEQVSETDAEEDDTVLSESEYADARSAEIMADNPNLDDVEAYNMALDEYPEYIGDMINSGKLSKIYKKANIGERIALNKSIQAAGYEISDVNVQEVNKKAESKFKVGDEVTATFDDGSVVSGVIEKIEDGKIKIRSNGRLYPVDESKIGKGVELQRGSLSLDGENPAFKAATEKTMQALQKTGVEVVMATEEQVQAVMEIADDERQMIADANERFNRELDAFKEKQHKGLLHLGRPMGVLSAAGVNVRELTLSPKVLNRKMKQHGLTTDDLKGLAKSIQSPILVYKHGEKAPNIVVVTELDINNGKLSIALELDDNGNVVEVNNISSVHSKDAATELERLAKMKDNGLKESLRWVEKEKVLNWFGIADLNSPIHTDNSELVSVANVINDFENPKVSAEFSRVYHGSGAKFDRFDHSFMGMGEGAQAFGWGTYVTEVEGIGRTYATSAARGKNIDYEKTSHAIAEALEKKIGIPTGSLYIMYDGRRLELDVVNGNNIREKLSEYTGIPIDEEDAIRHALAEDAADLIEEYEHIGQRYRYTVEIPDDNGSNYLHWEGVVSDDVIDNLQSELQKNFGEEVAISANLKHGQSGEYLYKKMERALGSDKAASEFLSRAGFVGISYPAHAT
ncbi:MAG: hypothetical protein IJC08_00330, partial [Bacteroidaceae bacterium]|nr:hypothetical protein [Bacteroidaceae bacterium]